MLPEGGLARDIQSWPIEILRAELERRQDVTQTQSAQRPKCGTKRRGAYDTPIHVFALVLILALSTIACAFPIIVRQYPKFPVPHQFIFLSRHFGTGVLIATAFVHLFPTAFTSLTDPCLPPFWNKRYPPMAGLLAMISVFVVVSIEQFFAMRGARHSHGSGFEVLGNEEEEDGHIHHKDGYAQAAGGSIGRLRAGSIKRSRQPPPIMLGDMNAHSSQENLIAGRSPSIGQPSPYPPGQSRFTGEEDEELDLDMDELNTTADLLNGNSKPHPDSSDPAARAGGSVDPRSPPDSNDASHRKALLQCLLLEAGILFHSVFIGMALSVTIGSAFAVLLIAISFHQTFEGLALGARIAALRFPAGSLKPWLMALAYGTTTPIGQAIGLVIHRTYDPASEAGLLSVGIMNAISSGLLLFAGLVQLLAEDFLSDASYEGLTGRRRISACVSVLCGAMLMALVGAWA